MPGNPNAKLNYALGRLLASPGGPDQIDRTYADWQRTHRVLSQAEHQAINARYPGATDEHCCECGQPTGNAGRGNGSLYCDECDEGPFCHQCFEAHGCKAGDSQ